MISIIESWAKDIALFYIIITFVNNMIISDEYRKYIKLFQGVWLIIIMVNPIIQIFGMENKMNELFDSFSGQVYVKDYDSDSAENIIKKRLNQIISDDGLEVWDCVIKINDGKINSAVLKIKPVDKIVERSYQTPERKIKTYLSNFYNVDENNIYIDIQR